MNKDFLLSLAGIEAEIPVCRQAGFFVDEGAKKIVANLPAGRQVALNQCSTM
jgi:hypothetical protein